MRIKFTSQMKFCINEYKYMLLNIDYNQDETWLWLMTLTLIIKMAYTSSLIFGEKLWSSTPYSLYK